MRVSGFVASVIAVLLIACVSKTTHAQQADSGLHRWGVGWDDGIGMRYLLAENWGLGLRFKPAIRDQFTDREVFVVTDTSSTNSKSPDQTRYNRSFEVSAMLFHSIRISQHVGLGPYIGIGFERRYYKLVDEPAVYDDVEYYSWNKSTTSTLFLEAGLRPTFEFFDRFVLETRIGVVLEHASDDYVDFNQSGGNERKSHNKYSTWSVSAIGRDIGPGAVMQFMIYF